MNSIFESVPLVISNNINKLSYNEITPKPMEIQVDINIEKILNKFPKPPPNSSESTKFDLLELSKITRYRTKSQTEFALLIDNRAENAFLPYLENNNLKYPKDIVDKFWNLYYPIVTNIKYYFNRARPWQLAAKYGIKLDYIKTQASDTPSYPSGHATYGYILANILTEIYPLHSSAFTELAEKISYSRQILGVHYNSDISAALKLTNIIYPKIKDHISKEK